MSDQINWTERRRFGRRPLNAEAVAELPGAVEIPCIIENLSEGGALLSFPTGVAPINLFDLSLENVPFRLRCEMRYQVGMRFGVRFMRVDQGEALVRHFFPATASPTSIPEQKRKTVDHAAARTTSVRQLRRSMLPHILPEPTPAVAPQAAPVSSEAVPAAPKRAATAVQSAPPPPPSNRPSRIVVKR